MPPPCGGFDGRAHRRRDVPRRRYDGALPRPRQQTLTRMIANGITHHASRITHHASRITHHASRITHHASRITHHASRITHPASRIPHPASRIPHPASRIPHPASRIPHHASRITLHASRFTLHASRFTNEQVAHACNITVHAVKKTLERMFECSSSSTYRREPNALPGQEYEPTCSNEFAWLLASHTAKPESQAERKVSTGFHHKLAFFRHDLPGSVVPIA
jgi:hypothetical protein